VSAVRRRAPSRIVVAVPVAASITSVALEQEVDDVVCVITPEPFLGVGAWYADFSQTTDDEVRALLG
jgi:predicted phosphoribosyltransferase